jgi:hypothetical protein
LRWFSRKEEEKKKGFYGLRNKCPYRQWVRIDKIKEGYRRDGVVWGLGAKVEVLIKPRLAREEYATSGHCFD